MGVRRGILKEIKEGKFDDYRVGVSYMVGDTILSRYVKVSQGERIGDTINYSDHHELWKYLILTSYPMLASYEMTDFPRLKVVFDMLEEKFIIYIDQKLNKEKFIKKICKSYGLNPEECIVNYKDASYHSLRTGVTLKLEKGKIICRKIEDIDK